MYLIKYYKYFKENNSLVVNSMPNSFGRKEGLGKTALRKAKFANKKSARSDQTDKLAIAKFLLELYQKALVLSEKQLDDYFLNYAVNITASSIGFFHFVSDDQKSILLTAWNAEALRNCVAEYNNHYPIESAGNWVDCVRLKHPIIYNDFAKSPNQKGFPAGHVLIKRFMSVPIFENDKIKIVFGVGNKTNPYTEDDVVQLQLIANELSKIYKQRQSEFDIYESEKKYHSLFENMLDGFAYCKMIFDDKGVPIDFEYLEINDAFERLTGLKRADVAGKRATVAIPGIEKANPELFEIYGRVALTCRAEKFEIFFKPLNKFFSIAVYCPLKGYFAAIFEDITTSKQAEESLLKLNRHLRAISNSNQALMHANDQSKYAKEVCNIIVKDCSYALVWVGLAEHDPEKTVRPLAFAGFDKHYIDALRITWDENSERSKGPTGTVIRTGKPYVCRNMQNDPNFKPWRKEALKRGYTASLVLPLISFEGKTFGALNIYSKESNPFRDEEVNLLAELANDFAYGLTVIGLSKEREHALETLQKQASLIDLSPNAIFVRQLDGAITFWSKGAETLYGWKKEESIGKNSHTHLQTEFPEPLDSIVNELKQKGHWSGELVHQTKNGRKIVVQSYWLAKLDEKGKIEELFEANMDVTDRKQMQAKLEEYSKHLEGLVEERTKQLKDAERLAAIGATAGMVGHDIRNPLQAMVGELFLAKDELFSLSESLAKKNLQENLNSIEENLLYIEKIVADLQDFARPLRPVVENVNVKDAIDAAFLIVNIPSNLQVSIIIEEGIKSINSDCSMLKRVLVNLIQNAVQAMSKGGKLTLNAYKEENHVIITVKDTGIGIPEAAKEKLFTPMFTTKSKGQGFGLAVVKRMTEALGGKIAFQSQEGIGTTFIVSLPAPPE
jgi:PAS domain S-box-containing protein